MEPFVEALVIPVAKVDSFLEVILDIVVKASRQGEEDVEVDSGIEVGEDEVMGFVIDSVVRVSYSALGDVDLVNKMVADNMAVGLSETVVGVLNSVTEEFMDHFTDSMMGVLGGAIDSFVGVVKGSFVEEVDLVNGMVEDEIVGIMRDSLVEEPNSVDGESYSVIESVGDEIESDLAESVVRGVNLVVE